MEQNEEKIFTDTADSIRVAITKIQSIKNLMRDGKYIVAYEKLQGVSDGLANALGRCLGKNATNTIQKELIEDEGN